MGRRGMSERGKGDVWNAIKLAGVRLGWSLGLRGEWETDICFNSFKLERRLAVKP
jgi:hypothetical protein